MNRLPALAVVVTCVLVACSTSSGADWPQFRHDAGRTAAGAESLPGELHLQWTRELPPPQAAYPGELRLRYDATYEPVVAGDTMFVPSMVTDSVTALDTDTGEVRWRFFTEGPVRFAPVAWDDKIYFVSDDGHLYCTNAADGKLLWKFRGATDDHKERKILGNSRMVSLFPARGGPVLDDGVIYFAAGIWSGEGVFVHALDAKTGKAIWSNVDSHHIEAANMDHGVSYYAGISPQGYLAIVDDKLVVPCGAQLPAVFDRKTGKLGAYTMGWGGRVGLAKGCWFVAGVRNYLLHGGDLYDIRRPNDELFPKTRGGSDFKKMLYVGGLTRLQIDRANQKALGNFRQPVLTPETMYYSEGAIVACDLTKAKIEQRAGSAENPAYRRQDQYPDKLRGTFAQQWRLPSESKLHIKVGDRLFCGRAGVVEAVDIPAEGEQPKIGWKAEIKGTPQSMLAADGKLFVVTVEGRILAFGEEKQTEKPSVQGLWVDLPAVSDRWTAAAADLLRQSDTRVGHILVLGMGSGQLAEELARESECPVLVIEADAERASEFRQKLDGAGLYGSRISVLTGDPATYPLPPYFASLIVSEAPTPAMADT
ncbi:MAG: PQQ-binding-like beta-propeller repeat protein, partial [Planctomycetes bacterium]|nr:PQQ-binding-like beta-propeller repeat protein [Planctomycetota bacterium]